MPMRCAPTPLPLHFLTLHGPAVPASLVSGQPVPPRSPHSGALTPVVTWLVAEARSKIDHKQYNSSVYLLMYMGRTHASNPSCKGSDDVAGSMNMPASVPWGAKPLEHFPVKLSTGRPVPGRSPLMNIWKLFLYVKGVSGDVTRNPGFLGVSRGCEGFRNSMIPTVTASHSHNS